MNEEKIDKKYAPSEHVIAYIDILGATEMIKNNNNVIQTIHTAYEEAYTWLEAVLDAYINAPQKGIFSYTKNTNPLKLKIFSDNIFISFPVSTTYSRRKGVSSAFGLIYFMVASFQYKLAKKYILTRGAISIGDIFIDDIMVWGKGLLHVYNLEHEKAIYPRVIVDKNIIELLEKGWDSSIIRLKKDADGIYYIDYIQLQTLHEDCVGACLLHIESANNKINNCNEEKNEKNERKKKKFFWYKRYALESLAECPENDKSTSQILLEKYDKCFNNEFIRSKKHRKLSLERFIEAMEWEL